jgi:hypothetical protein
VITADEDIGVGARFSLLPAIAATRTVLEAHYILHAGDVATGLGMALRT